MDSSLPAAALVRLSACPSRASYIPDWPARFSQTPAADWHCGDAAAEITISPISVLWACATRSWRCSSIQLDSRFCF